MVEPENDTLQSPSAHSGYLVPPALGAFDFCGAGDFGVVFALRDSSTVGDAEGSASRVVGEEPVAVGAVSGFDHVAPEEDSAVELQPDIARTSSSAQVAVRFVEEGEECCMRGV